MKIKVYLLVMLFLVISVFGSIPGLDTQANNNGKYESMCNWTSKYGNLVLKGNALDCGPKNFNLFNTWIYDNISIEERNYPSMNYSLNFQDKIFFYDKTRKDLMCLKNTGEMVWKNKHDIFTLLAIDNGFVITTDEKGLNLSFININDGKLSKSIDFSKMIDDYRGDIHYTFYYNSSMLYLSTDNSVYCFDINSNLLWSNKTIRNKTGSSFFTFVAKVNNYLIGAEDSLDKINIICINTANGDLIWHTPLGADLYPIKDCFAFNDSVFLNSGGYKGSQTITKFDLTSGSKLNQYVLSSQIFSDPFYSPCGQIIVKSNGNIVTSDQENNIYCFDSNLGLKWKLPPKSEHNKDTGFKIKSLACNNNYLFFTGFYGTAYKGDFSLFSIGPGSDEFDGHLFVVDFDKGKTLQENVIGKSIGNISIDGNSIIVPTSKGLACYSNIVTEVREEIVEINNMPRFEKVKFVDDNGSSQTFDRVILNDYNTIGEPGAPVLPVIPKLFQLPNKSRLINVETYVLEEIPIQGEYIIEPGQYPMKISSKIKPPFAKPNPDIYMSSSPATSIFGNTQEMNQDKTKFLGLTINPIKYIPSSKTISLYKKVKVKYWITKNQTTIFGNGIRPNSQIADFEKIDMVIVSTNEFIGQPDNNMDDFADYALWKSNNGFRTICVPISSLQNDGDKYTSLANKIRNMILRYHEFNSTKYFILGGDVEFVPTKKFVFDSKYCNINERGGLQDIAFFSTDVFYACLDDEWSNNEKHVWKKVQKRDWLPDVKIGRIPCSNKEELRNYILKAIAHQVRSLSDYGMNKIYLTCKLLFVPNDSEVFYKEIDRKYIRPANKESILHYAQGEFDMDKFANTINTNIPPIVATLSHGCPTDAVSDIPVLKKLKNKDKPFFMEALGPCTTNPFGGNDEWDEKRCMAEYYVLEKDNGAFGYVGNTHYQWVRTHPLIENTYFKEVFQNNNTVIGDVLNNIRANLFSLVNSNDEQYVWSFYLSNLLGDPSIDLFNNKLTPPPPTAGNWEMWGRTPDQTRVAVPGSGPNSDELKKEWEYTITGTDEQLRSSASIYEGKSYFMTGTRVICLENEKGTVKWEVNVGSMAYSPPCVYNGRVYVGFDNFKVMAFDANSGATLWAFSTNGQVLRTPVCVDNSIYFGSSDKQYYCLDAATGSMKWSFDAGGEITAHSCVVEGKVYFTSENKMIHCLDANDGTEIWSNEIPEIVKTTIAFSNNMLYFGGEDSKMHCYDANSGEELWTYQLDKPVQSSPAINYNRIYFGCENGEFTCLDALNGSLVWKFKAQDRVYSSPAIADSRIYFASHDKNLYCLDVATGRNLWSTVLDGEGWCSPAIANNQVIIGAGTNKVYCFEGTQNNPPPPNPPPPPPPPVPGTPCDDCKEFNNCDECNKFMVFKVGSKNWSICGKQQPAMEAAPVIKNGRICLLIRFITQTIGAQIEWDGKDKTVTITRTDGKTIKMTVGSGVAVVDGVEVLMDDDNARTPNKVAPFIDKGRTLIPLRFVVENVIVSDCTQSTLYWNDKTKEAKICYKDPNCIDDGLTFTLPDTFGNTKTEQDYRGKVTLIDFSASWCPPCRQSMPAIKKLRDFYGDDVNILTIDSFEELAKVIEFKDDEGVDWDFLYDEDGTFANVLGIKYIPTFLVLDEKGRIKFRQTGGNSNLYNILHDQIKMLVGR